MESDAQAEQFDRLFRSTLRRVTAYCLRRTSETAAHDAVSEVYATAWRKRRRLPADEDEAALWLLGVARNVLANQARGQRRWDRLLRRAAERPAPEQLLAPPADHGDDADHDLTEAMARLSDTDRELLRLAYWDDLSHGDIAQLLGISPGAVSTRLHRARERLRSRLEPDASDAHETKDLNHAQR